jgi:hypothetical protein
MLLKLATLKCKWLWQWLKSRSEIPGKFLNVVLEKDGK